MSFAANSRKIAGNNHLSKVINRLISSSKGNTSEHIVEVYSATKGQSAEVEAIALATTAPQSNNVKTANSNYK